LSVHWGNEWDKNSLQLVTNRKRSIPGNAWETRAVLLHKVFNARKMTSLAKNYNAWNGQWGKHHHRPPPLLPRIEGGIALSVWYFFFYYYATNAAIF
jgi:hypothetical protein